ncbi:MAG: ABC transporter permease [Spirochaetia bacterium]|jgi:ribose/xylose/arabinose/galactoside ABC-type transport system permease subunit
METKTVAVESRRARPLNQSIVLIALILAICVVTAIVNPRFLRVQNLINIFQQISILGIVACGIGMLLVAGQIDISVGTQISFLGVMLAMIIQKMMGLPDGGVPGWQSALAFPMAIVVTFAVGLAMGLINGLTVIYSRAASFIITLGFSTAYHGAALLLSGGASYMLFGRFELLGRGRVLDVVPISILFFLGMVGITFVVLRYFRYGRFLYAIGGNKKAAFVSGINTTRVTLIAYLVVGACNALAALILISRVGSALSTTGDSFALDSLAAVIVGGVALSGGRGSALSVFLGVLLIGLISNALIIMNVNPYVRDVVIGLIIVAAVTVSELSGQRRT